MFLTVGGVLMVSLEQTGPKSEGRRVGKTRRVKSLTEKINQQMSRI